MQRRPAEPIIADDSRARCEQQRDHPRSAIDAGAVQRCRAQRPATAVVDIGARRKKHRRDLRAPIDASDMQWRIASFVCAAKRRARLEQLLHHLHPSIRTGEVQRRPASGIRAVERRARREKLRHHTHVSALAGAVQRRRAAAVDAVHIRARLEQQRNNFLTTIK